MLIRPTSSGQEIMQTYEEKGSKVQVRDKFVRNRAQRPNAKNNNVKYLKINKKINPRMPMTKNR